MTEVELSYVSIHYDEPVIFLVFKDGVEIGFPEVREMTFYCEQLSGKKPYLVLSDARVNINVTPEGRKLAADPREAPLCKGSAVLVKNIMYEMAVNFFQIFNKPPFPYRSFTDKKKALEWLYSLELERKI
jgi:hypothetical protein